MQRVLTAEEMREADRLTIEERGVPGIILMENAASAVTDRLIRSHGPIGEQRVTIVCGKGNNGGDGLAVARQLLCREPPAVLRVVLLCDPAELGGDAATNWRMLRAQDFEPDIVLDSEAWRKLLLDLTSSTLLVDAILGTGLNGPARGLAAEAIADLNRYLPHAAVVAVDQPSGLASDNAESTGEYIKARRTITFTAPKVSQVLPPTNTAVGTLEVASIGTARSVLDQIPGPRLMLMEPNDVTPYVARRDPNAHKGSYGHVLVVGGSRSKPGAVRMTGTAALRAGAGLATVVTAATAAAAVVAGTPELMTEPAAELGDGSIGIDAWNPQWLERKSVVAVGPGLGTAPATLELVRRICSDSEVPVVVDADALRAFRDAPPTPRDAAMVLTPHPGEMAALAGLTTDQIQADRVTVARDYASSHEVYLVLKGNRSLIASPDGGVIVNPTGSPAMATAGSGDILTGMIAALLAQFSHLPVSETVAAAVYLHGLAGEYASREESPQAMLATDILASLPRAIDSLQS